MGLTENALAISLHKIIYYKKDNPQVQIIIQPKLERKLHFTL